MYNTKQFREAIRSSVTYVNELKRIQSDYYLSVLSIHMCLLLPMSLRHARLLGRRGFRQAAAGCGKASGRHRGASGRRQAEGEDAGSLVHHQDRCESDTRGWTGVRQELY